MATTEILVKRADAQTLQEMVKRVLHEEFLHYPLFLNVRIIRIGAHKIEIYFEFERCLFPYGFVEECDDIEEAFVEACGSPSIEMEITTDPIKAMFYERMEELGEGVARIWHIDLEIKADSDVTIGRLERTLSELLLLAEALYKINR